MYPVYQSMDSSPHYRNKMPCAPHYYPSFEAVPPQLKVDPAKSSETYESWFYGGNSGYQYPVGCHGCCSHNYFPAYYGFRPPYPHFPPPPQPLHCQGSYHVPYISPPQYSMEQPRYEYDQNIPQDYHCYGCPNHSCDRKEDRNLKIEECPDVEKKSRDYVVPLKLENYPYPVVWIPPGYMQNKDSRIPIELESKEGDKNHHDRKAHESVKYSEQEPSVWNGWVPLDMNSLGSLKQGGDGKKTQHQQDEDKSQLPFPIFWMPYKPEEVERKDIKDSDAGPEAVEESPSHFRIIPVKVHDNNDREGQARVSEKNSGSEGGLKKRDENAVHKMIPVKQVEQHEEKKTTKDVEGKAKGNPVIMGNTDDNGERQTSKDGAKRKSSSPPKTLKLPPVCLRVDPLPRRKNSNGTLRSPSPPANKGKSLELFNDNSESSTSSLMKENTQQDIRSPKPLDKSKEVEQSRSKTKTIQVVDGTTRKGKNDDLCEVQTRIPVKLPVNSHEEVSRSQTTSNEDSIVKGEKGLSNVKDKKSGEVIEAKKATVEGQSGDGECEIGEDKGASNEKEEKTDAANKAKRKKLSDYEAAVIIQSAYRGFEVRRWEPLKKLKELSKLTERIAEVKGHIQALESSSDLRSDYKQRVAVGETIMSLLLKLDTIQSLHPSIRNIRKSVARELVILQEKLDSLTIKKSEASIEPAPAAKPVEDLSRNVRADACMQGGQERAKVGLNSNLFESGNDIKSDIIDSCQGQPLHMMSGSKAVETSELMLVDKEVGGDSVDKSTEPPVASGVDSDKTDSEPLVEAKDEQNSEVFGIGQVLMSEMPKNHEVLELEQSVGLPLPVVAEENTNPTVEVTGSASLVVDSTSMDKDIEMIESVELPQKELDQDPNTQGSEKYEKIDIGKEVAPQHESILEIDAASQDVEVADMNQVEQQPEELLMERLISAELKGMLGSKQDKEEDEELVEVMLEPEKLPAEAPRKEASNTKESTEVSEVDDTNTEKDGELRGDARFELKDMLGSEEHEKEDDELLWEVTLETEEHPVEVQRKDVSHTDESAEFSELEEDKVALEKDGELVEDAKLELKEFVIQPVEEVININLPAQASNKEEPQPEVSFVGNEVHEGDVKGRHGIKEVLTEENKQSMVGKEIAASEEQEPLGGKCGTQELQPASGNDDMVDRPCGSAGTSEEELLVGTQFVPVSANQAEEGKVSPMSATASQVSLGSDIMMENDKRILEENEKLREMMEKLIEAGKEQLPAISNLSGRVKDLEKKLSRKKKLKMRKYK